MVRKSGSSSIKVCESVREVGVSLPPTHLFAVYSLVHSLCDTIFLSRLNIPAILHFTSRVSPPSKGGGWCSSDENCAGRALSTLGSSKNWGPTYTDFYEGSQIFSADEFANWNAVYAMYCDGGSWTGNISEPISAPPSQGAKNISVYYRGT